MFEALDTNPTLRERVLGLTAIGAILVGGAAGVDTMLTSGWQVGGDDANAAPVIYADALPQYQDDVNRDWTTTPPQRVQLAAQDASLTVDPSEAHDGLDGASSGTVTPASYAPSPVQQAIPAEPQTTADQQSVSDQRFEAIENDIRQATAALSPDTAKDDDLPPPSANDQG